MLALLLLRTSGANAALAASCGQWNIAKSPGADAGLTRLFGVTALSAADVWAVGDISKSNLGPAQTLIEHWNGKQWKIVSSPNVPSVSNVLNAVAAVSTSDIWAVGNTSGPNGMGQTLIEHWDGTQWSIVASPNPPQAIISVLSGVAAVSANDVWAVGISTPGQGPSVTLIEHWNGTQWSIVKSPNIPSNINDLQGIAATSSKEVWAVGSYQPDSSSSAQTLIERWNGKTWKIVSSPNPSTNAALWAVGDYTDNSGNGQTLIEQWDGKQWNVVSSPNISSADNFLDSVAASSANNVWAVGNYFSHTDDMYHTLTEFYC